MPKYTPMHFNLLLAHMLRRQDFAQAACRELQPMHLTTPEIGGALYHGVVFTVVQESLRLRNTIPDLAGLHAEAWRVIQQFFPQEDPRRQEVWHGIETFVRTLSIVDDRSFKLANEILQHILDVCVFRQKKREILQNPDDPELARRLTELDSRAKASIGSLATAGLLDKSFDEEDTGRRVPTNIPFFDAFFGAGAGPVTGSAMGLIAGQSSGKTTWGVQLGVSQASANEPALIAFVEEGMTASVRRNIMAATTGISTEVLEKCKDNLEEAIKVTNSNRDVVMTRKEAVNRNLHFLDLVKDPVGWTGIQQEIESLSNRLGKPPAYTYIDYAEVLASQMINLAGKSVEPDALRMALKQISHDVTNLAARTDSLICIAQQMDGALTRKGPTHIYDEYSSMSNKTFTGPFKYVVTLSPMDVKFGSKVQVMRVAKARNDAKHQTRLVRINGPYARFEDVSEYYRVQGKRFVQKEGGGHQVPTV